MQSAGCQGKRQFLTFTSAAGAAKNATRSNNAPMRPYPCRHCHKFHIGNVPPRERRNKEIE
jgi:hypothetical protein